jgi:integrase
VLGLTWGAVDLETRKLEVRQTLSERRVVGPDGRGKTVLEIGTPKTRNALREINLPDAVYAALKRCDLEARTRALAAGRTVDADDPVFPGPDGTWRYPSNVLSQFKRLLAREGLRPIRFHDLRHTTATLMLVAEVPLEQISQTLGHGSIQITKDTYAQYVPVLIPRAVNRLDEFLTGADEEPTETQRVVALNSRPTPRPGQPRYRGSDR